MTKIISRKQNSDLWVDSIINSLYIDKVLNSLIPTMTSNTCDVGTAYTVPTGSQYPAYRMFDNDATTYAGAEKYTQYPHYFGFNFNEIKKVYGISIPVNDSIYHPKDCEIEISNDGVNWNSIKSFTINNSGYNNKISFPQQLTKYFRIKANSGYYTNYDWSGIFELKIWGI